MSLFDYGSKGINGASGPDISKKEAERPKITRKIELKYCKYAAGVLLAQKIWDICDDILPSEIAKIEPMKEIHVLSSSGSDVKYRKQTVVNWVAPYYRNKNKKLVTKPNGDLRNDNVDILEREDNKKAIEEFGVELVKSLKYFMDQLPGPTDIEDTMSEREAIFDGHEEYINLIKYYRSISSIDQYSGSWIDSAGNTLSITLLEGGSIKVSCNFSGVQLVVGKDVDGQQLICDAAGEYDRTRKELIVKCVEDDYDLKLCLKYHIFDFYEGEEGLGLSYSGCDSDLKKKKEFSGVFKRQGEDVFEQNKDGR